MAGRKTKLRRKLIAEAVEGIEKGHYAKTICQALGIHESTYYDWLKKGEEQIENDERGIYREFSESIKKAQAEGKKALLQIIRDRAATNWTAAAWMLERMYPEEYGRREKHQHEGTPNKPIEFTMKLLRDGDTDTHELQTTPGTEEVT